MEKPRPMRASPPAAQPEATASAPAPFIAESPMPAEARLGPTFHTFDRILRAAEARVTQGVSPTAVAGAWADWAMHFARAPGKQMELATRAWLQGLRYMLWLRRAASGEKPEPLISPPGGDRRFADPAWSVFPFNAIAQAHLLNEAWWMEATHAVPGLSRRHTDQVGFMMRQAVDVLAPSNIPWINPAIVQRTIADAGSNLLRGAENLLDDMERGLAAAPPAGAPHFRNAHLGRTQPRPRASRRFARKRLIHDDGAVAKPSRLARGPGQSIAVRPNDHSFDPARLRVPRFDRLGNLTVATSRNQPTNGRWYPNGQGKPV